MNTSEAVVLKCPRNKFRPAAPACRAALTGRPGDREGVSTGVAPQPPGAFARPHFVGPPVEYVVLEEGARSGRHCLPGKFLPRPSYGLPVSGRTEADSTVATGRLPPSEIAPGKAAGTAARAICWPGWGLTCTAWTTG